MECHIFFDKVSTSTPHPTDTLEVGADRAPWPRSFSDAGMALLDAGPNAWFTSHVALSSLDQLEAPVTVCFLYKHFRLWILYSAPLIRLSEEGVDVF